MRSQHHYPHRSLIENGKIHSENAHREKWIPYSLRIRGGALTRVIPQILCSGAIATAVCCLSRFTSDNFSLHSPVLFPVFGFIVGLSISFRMQSAYSRWWEGRAEWDKLSALVRSMTRTIWLHVPDKEGSIEEFMAKKMGIKLLHAFAVALKHHLRGERDWSQMRDLRELTAHLPHYMAMPGETNHPMELLVYISSYVEQIRTTKTIDTQVLTHLLTHVDGLTAIVSACERLLRTPVPLGYNIAISRIVWIFILALPSQLYRTLGWGTIPTTMITAYVLFALAEIGLEIENPWGMGPNDLDLERYCDVLGLDLEQITARSPKVVAQWISIVPNATPVCPEEGRLIVLESRVESPVASRSESRTDFRSESDSGVSYGTFGDDMV